MSSCSEFWLGLDKMHEYTKRGNWKLKVEIKYDALAIPSYSSPLAGTWGIGEWENFTVASEADKYRLTIGRRIRNDNITIRSYTTFDPFFNHNGAYFSTEEEGRDNDKDPANCARERKGSWWFSACKSEANHCLNCRDRHTIWYDPSNWQVPSRSRMWMMRTSWCCYSIFSAVLEPFWAS